MELRPLGRTDLKVTSICLGTMTWGSQNTEAEAHEQMDYAVSEGINFFDTAELYAVPPDPKTQGKTEEHIGTWFEKTGKRKDIILATKIIGPSPGMQWIRQGSPKLDRENIAAAIESSLKRLKTDYIDLYQIHWPARKTNRFGKLGYTYDPTEEVEDVLETLEILDSHVKAGTIRHIGLSNDTPWGVHRFLHLSEVHGLTRIQSIQNAYNLLNRTYEVGLAEMSIREDCGLLAYSPLARGWLSGKYLDGQIPEGSFRHIDPRPGRYDKPRCEDAIREYVRVAQQHGLRPDQMAIAFVTQQPFVTSNIIGATTMEQLKINIAAHDMRLSDEVLEAIEQVHTLFPNPGP